MKNTFFFDGHPPLGKQLITLVAYLANYDGKFKFDRIGTAYTENVPLIALRFVPALFGSLILPTTYHLLVEMGFAQWTSLLAGILLLLDNALLTQSRFILMESILLFFILFGILCILKFRKCHEPYTFNWWTWQILALSSLTCATCTKYVGFYSFCLGIAILGYDLWNLLAIPQMTDRMLLKRFITQALLIVTIPSVIYVSVFYVHLQMLYKAGPHDSIMTSAFQASLEGGLASITKGQPLLVAHGSQITLRCIRLNVLLYFFYHVFVTGTLMEELAGYIPILTSIPLDIPIKEVLRISNKSRVIHLRTLIIGGLLKDRKKTIWLSRNQSMRSKMVTLYN